MFLEVEPQRCQPMLAVDDEVFRIRFLQAADILVAILRRESELTPGT